MGRKHPVAPEDHLVSCLTCRRLRKKVNYPVYYFAVMMLKSLSGVPELAASLADTPA